MHEVVERALELSKADDCIAIGFHSSSANVRWANNAPTTNGTGDSVGLHVASIIDGRVGIVRRDVIDVDTLPELMRESEAACEGKPRAEDAMPLLEGDGAPDDWTAGVERTDIGALSPAVPGLADLFAQARAADVLTYGYAEHGMTNAWLGTSSGIRRRETRPQGKIEFTAKSHAGSRSTWNGRVLNDFNDVDVPAMWSEATTRLGWQAHRTEMPAGHYEVLLEPSCVADMIMYMFSAFGRRDADEGRSVFSKPGGNKLGEKLFPDGVSLYSDPDEPGLEATPFVVTGASGTNQSLFDNGLPIARTDWVKDGVLQKLITSRFWAAKSATEPAPNVGNMVYDGGGDADMHAMITDTDGTALLVNCLWYIRAVDPQTLLLTGLTRDGVYLVEGGEVKGAVNNFRFNMSPVTMLANLVEAGAPVPTLPREFEFGLTKMPPARIANWHMSSVSAAT